MSSEPKHKGGAGRPRNPPPPPALGMAERSGDGWKFTIVLGGLKVNGKKFDPQAGAELLAGMLEDGMKRIQRSEPSPEKALADLEAADSARDGDAAGGIAESSDPDHPATNDDGDVPTAESSDVITSPEPAMAPGGNGKE
jgi:hypothetical protein